MPSPFNINTSKLLTKSISKKIALTSRDRGVRKDHDRIAENFQIGIGIAISISDEDRDQDRDQDRDLDFGDRGHALN